MMVPAKILLGRMIPETSGWAVRQVAPTPTMQRVMQVLLRNRDPLARPGCSETLPAASAWVAVQGLTLSNVPERPGQSKSGFDIVLPFLFGPTLRCYFGSARSSQLSAKWFAFICLCACSDACQTKAGDDCAFDNVLHVTSPIVSNRTNDSQVDCRPDNWITGS